VRYRLLLGRRRRKKKTTTKRLRRISTTTLAAAGRRAVVLRARTKHEAKLPAAERFDEETVVLDEGGLRIVHVVERATRRLLTRTTCTLAGVRDWEAWDRFKHECEVLRSLVHPSIPRWVDHGEADGVAFLVTERVEGRTLQDRLARSERYTDAKLSHMLARGLEVLHYLHELNPPLYHCDVHPSTIVISDGGRLTLTGFGHARGPMAPDENAVPHARDGYGAPERARGEIDPANDLYAFGATLAAIASGRDASLLPTRGLQLDVDACMKPSPARDAVRSLLDTDPEARMRAAARLRVK
jgi:serine/threonine protein kinase